MFSIYWFLQFYKCNNKLYNTNKFKIGFNNKIQNLSKITTKTIVINQK